MPNLAQTHAWSLHHFMVHKSKSLYGEPQSKLLQNTQPCLKWQSQSTLHHGARIGPCHFMGYTESAPLPGSQTGLMIAQEVHTTSWCTAPLKQCNQSTPLHTYQHSPTMEQEVHTTSWYTIKLMQLHNATWYPPVHVAYHNMAQAVHTVSWCTAKSIPSNGVPPFTVHNLSYYCRCLCHCTFSKP